MVGDRRIEGVVDVVMERRESRSHLGQCKYLSMADRSIRIDDGMQALALGKARVNGGGQAAQFHGKTNMPMADEDTRHKLPSGSRDDGLADRVLKLTCTSQRKTQHFRHEELPQRFAVL